MELGKQTSQHQSDGYIYQTGIGAILLDSQKTAAFNQRLRTAAQQAGIEVPALPSVLMALDQAVAYLAEHLGSKKPADPVVTANVLDHAINPDADSLNDQMIFVYKFMSAAITFDGSFHRRWTSNTGAWLNFILGAAKAAKETIYAS